MRAYWAPCTGCSQTRLPHFIASAPPIPAALRKPSAGGLRSFSAHQSDLRCNPHFHTVFLDGVYVRDKPGGAPVFFRAPPPSQADVQSVVHKTAKRIVRFLQKRGLIALATAPGDGEVTVIVGDESLGEEIGRAHV